MTRSTCHFYTRSENWKVLTFTLFQDLQSETFLLSLFFEKGKRNQNDLKNARGFFKGCFHSLFSRSGSKNTQLSTSVEVKRKWSEIGNKKWNLQEKILENSQETGFSLGTACLTTIDFYSSPKLHQYWPWFMDWEW